MQLPSIVVEKQLGMRMVLIPRGQLTMGSPHHEPHREFNEMEHVRSIRRAFWLGETEVTQAQWSKLMSTNPSRTQGDNHPIENVSWDECQAFLAKLNQGGGAFRLPSEAEWEYACRARTTSAFHCGARLREDQFCFDASRKYDGTVAGASRKGTVPVRSLPPNGLGLYEMHGNVAEWCEDVLEDYPSSGTEEPVRGAGPRIYRGGSWSCAMKSCRSAARDAMPASTSDSKIGFRVARGL